MKGRKGWQRRSGKKYHGAQKLQCKKEGKPAADLPLSAWLLDSALAGSFGSYILSQSNGALEQCRKATSYNVLLTASIEGHGTIIWDLKQVRVPMVMHSSDTAQVCCRTLAVWGLSTAFHKSQTVWSIPWFSNFQSNRKNTWCFHLRSQPRQFHCLIKNGLM